MNKIITKFSEFVSLNENKSEILNLDKYYQDMPKKQVEELVEYWSMLKRSWNKGISKLSKKEIDKLKEVQKYIHLYYPEFDSKFHSKENGLNV
jgi:uridine kinase